MKNIVAGITLGDANGIGPELIIKTFSDKRMLELCTPVIYGNKQVILHYKKLLENGDFRFEVLKPQETPKPGKIYLRQVGENIKIETGESSKEAGKLAFKALETATHELADNLTDILITAPINKKNIQSEEFKFPGHTEYLANYANEDYPLMLMVHGDLRIGTVTNHLPLKDVSSSLDKDLILKKLMVFNKTLKQDFRIQRPKIAVLSLNPHSGDEGLLGEEENSTIKPALKEANEMGLLTFGPFAADGFFGNSNYRKFDGILAMYHDQGLIPFKSISANEGVNFTAGLPIVRTSPDHGTAYDIAGKNIADAQSFRQAIYLACDVYKRRKEYRALKANSL
ncbi:MAG: 4-hydroxythreonine-4-phosphate dehydrogenase PdxA [Flavobacteriales bacterium]|nr:4-hydroxythreonine-4-phosphate dehydrogenase PdxA [Flavobacteriales bacterium]